MGQPVENVSHVDISVISVISVISQIKPFPNIATHIPIILVKLLYIESSYSLSTHFD